MYKQWRIRRTMLEALLLALIRLTGGRLAEIFFGDAPSHDRPTRTCPYVKRRTLTDEAPSVPALTYSR